MLTALPFGANGAKLLIEPTVLQRLAAFRQLVSSAPEAGGILMGYRRGPHTHVTEATVPSPDDVQRRFGFFRHATHHQRVALRRWKETDQTLDYVGEWHTHPENDPTPSSTDLRYWRDIVAASARPMIFVIIGRSTNWIGAGLRNRTIAIQSCGTGT
jgi:integrative and conjugative element protein (TIGR02256 family)